MALEQIRQGMERDGNRLEQFISSSRGNSPKQFQRSSNFFLSGASKGDRSENVASIKKEGANFAISNSDGK